MLMIENGLVCCLEERKLMLGEKKSLYMKLQTWPGSGSGQWGSKVLLPSDTQKETLRRSQTRRLPKKRVKFRLARTSGSMFTKINPLEGWE
jgi:hypothetical protein